MNGGSFGKVRAEFLETCDLVTGELLEFGEVNNIGTQVRQLRAESRVEGEKKSLLLVSIELVKVLVYCINDRRLLEYIQTESYHWHKCVKPK